MICKDIDNKSAANSKLQAGIRQEQDVAFFLKRAFADKPDIRVFNDLKFVHDGETAQIDHLILYSYGFILIESKSITGHVKVNQLGEWQRSYQGNWSGMRSPIKQVELQQQLLRAMLFKHREEILPKIIMGKVPQNFGKRSWDNLCAISSNAIIERDDMPSDISKMVVKSEFIADKVIEMMDIPSILRKAFTTRPAFNEDEIQSIETFLLEQHQGNSQVEEKTEGDTDKLASNSLLALSDQTPENYNVDLARSEKSESVSPAQCETEKAVQSKNDLASSFHTTVNENDVTSTQSPSQSPLIKCKKCSGHTQLTAAYGKHGYYVICASCETNTSMRIPCPTCGNKRPKITKKRASYTLNCGECETSMLVYEQAKTSEVASS
ncbi:nuclease-related domain-containing protein [Motilimonas eburnea]|uniref:nuclease-related domain-containing protein n=1 Tax=Motilimonas eburnea TaxID=1737488 RepID=UPI001E47A90D|nr:nuclease-related domain-containing protein [Motilimonas eburnea]